MWSILQEEQLFILSKSEEKERKKRTRNIKVHLKKLVRLNKHAHYLRINILKTIKYFKKFILSSYTKAIYNLVT